MLKCECCSKPFNPLQEYSVSHDSTHDYDSTESDWSTIDSSFKSDDNPPNFSFFLENLPNELNDKIMSYLNKAEKAEYLAAAVTEFVEIVKPKGVYFYDLFDANSNADDSGCAEITDQLQEMKIYDCKNKTRLANKLKLYLRLQNNGKNFWPRELLKKVDIEKFNPNDPEEFLASFVKLEKCRSISPKATKRSKFDKNPKTELKPFDAEIKNWLVDRDIFKLKKIEMINQGDYDASDFYSSDEEIRIEDIEDGLFGNPFGDPNFDFEDYMDEYGSGSEIEEFRDVFEANRDFVNAIKNRNGRQFEDGEFDQLLEGTFGRLRGYDWYDDALDDDDLDE